MKLYSHILLSVFLLSNIIYTFDLQVFKGRISSYKPGIDAMCPGTRLAGARCLNMPKDLWNHKGNYPIPVCAMRAGCRKGKVRYGDIAEIVIKKKNEKVWKHKCIILDSGPWGCIDKNGKWHNCYPRGRYKGKLPKGWRWKSIVDVTNPSKGYPGGGYGKVRVFHFYHKRDIRRNIILSIIKDTKIIMVNKQDSKWIKTIKF